MSTNTELKKFGYLKASSASDAVSLLTKYAGNARIIGGATDVLNLMKNGVVGRSPGYVIDISSLNLSYINYSSSDGLHVGATTTLTTVANDANVNEPQFKALAQAANAAASPEIENQATIAGDFLQEVWCWYLRNNYPSCWRNGGNICNAAYGGDNRYYHSIFGGNLCYAVNPSDVAPALFALNADVTIVGPQGQRSGVPVSQVMPGTSIVDGRVTEISLAYNELVTEIHVPPQPSGAVSTFYKVSDRGTIDFALASAAVRATMNGSTVSNCAIYLGGVSETPYHATSAENYLNGKSLTESVIVQAGNSALSRATPLTTGTTNGFKVQVAKGALTHALRNL